LDWVFGEDFGEVAELAGGSAELEGIGLAVGVQASGDGDAGRVIAAIFEAREAFHDDGNTSLGSDVTNDSAHAESVLGWRD
jgi:hypothetical protein